MFRNSLLKGSIVICSNKEQFSILLGWLEDKGWEWISHQKPTINICYISTYSPYRLVINPNKTIYRGKTIDGDIITTITYEEAIDNLYNIVHSINNKLGTKDNGKIEVKL
ncbi:MAG: hypothetical protein PF569_03870 [Candidatus Woesearchaeota archaeon]|jgi:hypothetical protein|nr:hypothetical protein [Candidatus Woesearchaeota archaeon]